MSAQPRPLASSKACSDPVPLEYSIVSLTRVIASRIVHTLDAGPAHGPRRTVLDDVPTPTGQMVRMLRALPSVGSIRAVWPPYQDKGMGPAHPAERKCDQPSPPAPPQPMNRIPAQNPRQPGADLPAGRQNYLIVVAATGSERTARTGFSPLRKPLASQPIVRDRYRHGRARSGRPRAPP
jgi:hypothetical protein